MGDYREISFPLQNMHSSVINYRRRAHNLPRTNKQDSRRGAGPPGGREAGREHLSLQPAAGVSDQRAPELVRHTAGRPACRPAGIVKIGRLMPPISGRIKDGRILELMESLCEPGKTGGAAGRAPGSVSVHRAKPRPPAAVDLGDLVVGARRRTAVSPEGSQRPALPLRTRRLPGDMCQNWAARRVRRGVRRSTRRVLCPQVSAGRRGMFCVRRSARRVLCVLRGVRRSTRHVLCPQVGAACPMCPLRCPYVGVSVESCLPARREVRRSTRDTSPCADRRS